MQTSTKTLIATCAALLLTAALTGAADAQFRAFEDPYGYWSFDRCDGTTTYDAAVTPHHASLYSGAACSGWGQYGSSGYFDGVDNRVEAAGTTGFNPDSVSATAWVYPFTTSGYRSIVNKWYGGDAWALVANAGAYEFTVGLDSGSNVTARGGTVSTSTWTHVAGTYDGSYVRLYVNGSLAASVYAPGTLRNSNRPIAIGSWPSWNTFSGYVDEVRVYPKRLWGADFSKMAITPSGVGVRGLHLMPSKWVCGNFVSGSCNSTIYDQFRTDLGYITSANNLNSVKTAIYSMMDQSTYRSFWRDQQRAKLSYLKSATGNHQTWILRAWPLNGVDCSTSSNYYNCGYDFARNLADVFDHVQNTLKMQYVYIEVANEPNISAEPLFYDANPYVSMGRYNDFFRGFYDGERSVGYSFPLIYAGLSPGCSSGGTCTADQWYQDYWVRWHIQNYAAKVGVHVYWDSTNPYAWNGRLQQTGGLYYRRVRNILASGSYTPAVSPKGLPVTEFNFNKATTGSSYATQANEFCAWWQQAAADAAAGWWVEQSTLFITDSESGTWTAEYEMDKSQIDDVANCR